MIERGQAGQVAEQMARLFPGATILRERFLGWTKSLVAMKRG